MLADQPEVFFHRLLKQTHPYLAKKGQHSARKIQQDLKEATVASEKALKMRQSDDARQFDL